MRLVSADRPVRVGLPNRGRLHELVLGHISSRCWISEEHPRRLWFLALNGAVELICVRSTDVPQLLDDGVLDLGITGSDYVTESGIKLQEILDLGYGTGLLSVLVAKDDPADNIEDLEKDVRIATQYPVSTLFYLRPLLPELSIRTVDGAAEVYPHLGLCRAIVDIVSTGDTARANDMRSLYTLSEVSARVYRTTFVSSSTERQLLRVCQTLFETSA